VAEQGSAKAVWRPPWRRAAPIVLVSLLHALVLCALTGLLLFGFVRWRGRRYRSARPVGEGFTTDVAALCAHPGVAARQWRYIVVHHSATTGGSAAAFERHHTRVRGWKSLGYHFVIGNGTQTGDGEIEVGGRWERQEAGSHAGVREFNEAGIGICLVGDFNRQWPTELQMRSLEALVRCLMARYGIPPDRVLGHRECHGAATECPGRNLREEEFRALLRGAAALDASVARPPAIR